MNIPEELSRRTERLKAIAEAKTEIERRAAQRYAREKEAYDKDLAERAEKEQKTGKKPCGREPTASQEQISGQPGTDGESRIMPKSGSVFEQAYNAQAGRAKGSMRLRNTTALSILSVTREFRQLAIINRRKESKAKKMKQNCWEFKNCGRHPGGHRVKELGVCPVTTFGELTGVHGGTYAGRACWVVAGSLCGGKIQGEYAQKLNNCWRCDFMNADKQEEDQSAVGFSATRLGMEKSLQRQASSGEVSGNFNH